MQVFKMFFKIANRNKLTIIIYIVVFLTLIMMMSLSSQKTSNAKFTAQAVDITIIDNDDSELSHSIVEFLGYKHNIVKLKNIDSESLTDNLFYQKISYILTIPEGFEKDFPNLSKNTTLNHSMRKDSAAGYFVNTQLEAYLNTIRLYVSGGYELKDAISSTLKKENAPKEVKTIAFNDSNLATNDIMFYYFQYLAYILIMIMPNGIIPILSSFNKKNIKARMACSATSTKYQNSIIGLSCGVYSILIWLFFILLALIAFKPSNLFSENGLLCLANSFVFLLISISLTLLLSIFNLKDHALNLVCNIIGLGMSFLCGIFVPQWLLSESVLSFGKFLPAYWYVKIINMSSGWVGEEINYNEFFKYLGIEALFVIALFTMYLAVSRQKKQQSLA